jgi:biotin carboxyl carrier protein
MAKQFVVTVNGKSYEVVVEEKSGAQPIVSKVTSVETQPVASTASTATATGTPVVAPMGGLLKDVLVSVGDKVTDGQVVALVEVMKMDTEIIAEMDGVVESIQVNKGDNLDSGDVVITLK